MVWINFWILGIFYLVVFIWEDKTYNTHNINWFFGAFFIIYALIYYFRVRVYQILLVFGLFGLGYFHVVLAYDHDLFLSLPTLFVHIIILIPVGIFGMPVVVRAYKLEVHSRKLFRLASEQVKDVSDGYTPRPFFAGKAQFAKEEILGFTRYLSGKDIARYRMADGMVIVGLSMGISPLADPSFDRISTVTFSLDGNVYVHISEHDYRLYREKLSFDQLCASLGNVFTTFLSYYRNGTDERIITELKSV
jgi:hypothetical protein